ncbi:glutathione S-transferase family protein [Radicibacter daui]|uniref:glutathione S-transferase family protein n=1 Tax=Radicibacter daui TaxID=3064829 RepID=UPI0040469E52
MTQIEIIGIPVSNYVRAVRMACEEKGVAYRLTPAMPQSEEVRLISPVGKIPVMRHGPVTLCESRAIAGYLDTIFPEMPLLPKEPLAAAEVEQWISLVNTTMDRPFIREYVLGYVVPRGADGGPDRAAIAAVVPVMEQQLAVLEAALEGKEFLAGDRFSFADINLMPMLAGISAFPEGARALAASPVVAAYFERHARRPSFIRTAVDRRH